MSAHTAERDVCDGCQKRPCVCETVVLPTAENDALAEASDIDAELQDLQSFVLVETGHMPTVNAVAALRSRIAKTLGHSDPWCVSHCRPGVKHSMCGCRCGQHRKRPIPPAEGDRP